MSSCFPFLFVFVAVFSIKFLVFFLYSIIDRLDGVRLLWSLLKSNNPNVSLIFLSQHFHPLSNFTDKVDVQEPVAWILTPDVSANTRLSAQSTLYLTPARFYADSPISVDLTGRFSFSGLFSLRLRFKL